MWFLSSSVHFYQFSLSFYEYSFFINSVVYNISNVNSVTNILNNDFYITYLFAMNNRFLFCNYKVTKNKSNMSKISITSDNNVFFLVIVLVIFRAFNRKRREQLKLCYLAIFLIVILLLKSQIKDGFPFNFTSLQICLTNEFFNILFYNNYKILFIIFNI